MTTATPTSKGQITIPISVRTALGVDTGDRVEFVPVEGGRFELVAATFPVTALKGRISRPRTAVGIDDMNAAIARRADRAARAADRCSGSILMCWCATWPRTTAGKRRRPPA